MQYANTTIETENNKADVNITDLKFPRMVSLQVLSDECGIPYKALWLKCKQNKIIYIKTGNKYLVNAEKFIDYLNTGEHE